MINIAQFTGEMGGLLCVAFGMGCATGYGFAIRTAYRAVKDRLDKVEQRAAEDERRCEGKITALELRQRELEDMLLGRRALGFFSKMAGPQGGEG